MIKNLAFSKLKNAIISASLISANFTCYVEHRSKVVLTPRTSFLMQNKRKCPKICCNFRSDKFPNPKFVAVDQFSFPIINYLLALSLVWMKNKQDHKKRHYIIHWETTLMDWKIHMKWYSEFRSMVLSVYINAYLFVIHSFHL